MKRKMAFMLVVIIILMTACTIETDVPESALRSDADDIDVPVEPDLEASESELSQAYARDSIKLPETPVLTPREIVEQYAPVATPESLDSELVEIPYPLEIAQYRFENGINGNGEPATLHIELHEVTLNCFSGGYFEGKNTVFNFKFDDGEIISTVLPSIVVGAWSFPNKDSLIKLEMVDCSGDQVPEFIMATGRQVSGGMDYTIFSIEPEGTVTDIPFGYDEKTLIKSNTHVSQAMLTVNSSQLHPTPEGFYFEGKLATGGGGPLIFDIEALVQWREENPSYMLPSHARDYYQWHDGVFVGYRQEFYMQPES